MNIRRNLAVAAMAGALLALLAGCPRNEGPGEKAGKAVDRAVDNTGKQMEKMGEQVRDASKEDRK